MLRLLPVTIKRAFCNMWFWIGLICMILMSLYNILNNYQFRYLGSDVISPDNTLFSGYMAWNWISVVYVSMFVGTEYSNKTIRNKIIVGHSKQSIYICNLIACTVALLVMHLAYCFINASLGVVLLGEYKYPEVNLIFILCSVVNLMAKVALLILLSMLITRKTICLIVMVALVYALQFGVSTIDRRLNETELVEVWVFDEEIQDYVISGMEDNPLYIKNNTVRTVCEQILYIVPYGQELHYSGNKVPDDIVWFPVYAVSWGALCTAVGVSCFKRKDLN